MSKVKVTVEKDGESVSYSGEFAVVGMVSGGGDEKVVTAASFGGTTAYGAAMLGCQVAAKLVEPFNTMERIGAGDEV